MMWKSPTVVRYVAGSLVEAAIALASPASPMRAQTGAAPKYEVDPTWPKPFPDRWVIGGLGGLCVDANDHVLILNPPAVLHADLNSFNLSPPIIQTDSA